MTTDANDNATEELDIDFIESYFGKQGIGLDDPDSTGEVVTKTEEPEKDEEDTKSSEDPNGLPTTAEVKTYTEEELESAVASRFTSLREKAQTELSRREEEKKAKELDDLIRNGNPEDVTKFIRDQLNEKELRDRVGTEEVSNYVALILPSILTPEFVESLTDEEAQSLDPSKFESDADYFKAATLLRETKAKSGLFDEDEVKRRVKEEVEAQKNEARGQRVRQPSATATPRTEDGNGMEGLTGRRAKDAQWAQIEQKWTGEDDE